MVRYDLLKIGEFMKKLFSNIIIDLILFDLLFGVTCLIVDKLGLEYLKWVKQTILIINCIGIISGIVQLLMMIENKTEKIIMIILVIINLLLFSKIILGTIAIFIYELYPPEYIIEIENKKMVGYVINGYETRVDYYKYKNIFTREKNRTYEENYGKGSFNPFEEEHSILTYYYYDKEGKLEKQIDTIQESEDLKEDNLDNEESAILYEKQIDKNIAIRVKRECFILAQREVISIQKTIDEGKNWNNQSSGMTIHSGADFIFIDEEIGFINDYGLAGMNGENSGLLVTNNGGKSFLKVKIELDGLKRDTQLYINDVPYKEGNILKVQTYIIEQSKKKYYYFYSEDNGLNWKIESEKE